MNQLDLESLSVVGSVEPVQLTRSDIRLLGRIRGMERFPPYVSAPVVIVDIDPSHLGEPLRFDASGVGVGVITAISEPSLPSEVCNAFTFMGIGRIGYGVTTCMRKFKGELEFFIHKVMELGIKAVPVNIYKGVQDRALPLWLYSDHEDDIALVASLGCQCLLTSCREPLLYLQTTRDIERGNGDESQYLWRVAYVWNGATYTPCGGIWLTLPTDPGENTVVGPLSFPC